MSASLLLGTLGVKALPASASDGGYRQFFLDQGFLGRDFSLDLEDISIGFSSTTIPYPGVLHLSTVITDATGTASGLPRYSPDFRIEWTTNMPLIPEKVSVRLKGDCGQAAWRGCALEETYQGKTRVVPSRSSGIGFAEALISMGATVRLVANTSYMSQGDASWYAYKSCPCAASPDFPKGTLVRVTKLSDPQKSIVVKINDWGPERDKFPERAIDLDKVAFAQLASTGAGVIKVKVEPLMPGDPAIEAYNLANPPVTNVAVKTVAPVSTAIAKPEPEWQL